MGTATVERMRQQCIVEGIEAGWERTVQVNRKKRQRDGDGEVTLAMLSCSTPPQGHAQWRLQLLCEKVVE